jgi:hypothetical protein
MSQGIKPWQDRVRESYSETVDGPTLSPINAACAEIADLRAELARRCRAQRTDKDSENLAAQATHAGAEIVGHAELNRFMDGYCNGKPELMACAQSAMFFFNACARAAIAAHAAQDGDQQ